MLETAVRVISIGLCLSSTLFVVFGLKCSELHYPHLLHENFCYVWVRDRYIKYAQAVSACGDGTVIGRHGQIALPRGEDQFKALLDFLTNSGHSDDAKGAPLVGIKRSRSTAPCPFDIFEDGSTVLANISTWWHYNQGVSTPSDCTQSVSKLRPGYGLYEAKPTEGFTFICQFDCAQLPSAHHVQMESACVAVEPATNTLEMANLLCAGGMMGSHGHLAILDSQAKTNSAQVLVTEAALAGSVYTWVGLLRNLGVCVSHTDGWFWADGSYANDVKWHTGEPGACTDRYGLMQNSHDSVIGFGTEQTVAHFICEFVCAQLDASVDFASIEFEDKCFVIRKGLSVNYDVAERTCVDGSLTFSGILAMPKRTLHNGQLSAIFQQLCQKAGVSAMVGLMHVSNACLQADYYSGNHYMNGKHVNIHTGFDWHAVNLCSQTGFTLRESIGIYDSPHTYSAHVMCEMDLRRKVLPVVSKMEEMVSSLLKAFIDQCLQRHRGRVIGDKCYYQDQAKGKTWEQCHSQLMAASNYDIRYDRLVEFHSVRLFRLVTDGFETVNVRYHMNSKRHGGTMEAYWMLDVDTPGLPLSVFEPLPASPLQNGPNSNEGYASYEHSKWHAEYYYSSGGTDRVCAYEKDIPFGSKYKVTRIGQRLKPTAATSILGDLTLKSGEDERHCAIRCMEMRGCMGFNHWLATLRCELVTLTTQAVYVQIGEWVIDAQCKFYEKHY